MSSARRCLLLFALYGSPFLIVPVTAQNQTPSSLPKLSLTAALVLTPDFCATVNKKGHEAFLGGSEKFPVGKTACNELEPALNGIFTSLTRVDDSSKRATPSWFWNRSLLTWGPRRGPSHSLNVNWSY